MNGPGGAGPAGAIDRVTAVLALPVLLAPWLPWFTYRPSRIAPGQARSLAEALGGPAAVTVGAAALVGMAVLLVLRRPGLRAALAGGLLLAALAVDRKSVV